MNGPKSWIRYAAVFAVLGSVAVSQRPPDEPFQSVHMLTVRPGDEEKKLLAAMADINSAIAKGGCPSCTYHLWKAFEAQSGPFNYLWISNWPGRDIYEKVHLAPGFIAANQRHPEIQAIIGTQLYNRYVEVKQGN